MLFNRGRLLVLPQAISKAPIAKKPASRRAGFISASG
jgi:hypothetical protein